MHSEGINSQIVTQPGLNVGGTDDSIMVTQVSIVAIIGVVISARAWLNIAEVMHRSSISVQGSGIGQLSKRGRIGAKGQYSWQLGRRGIKFNEKI